MNKSALPVTALIHHKGHVNLALLNPLHKLIAAVALNLNVRPLTGKCSEDFNNDGHG
jgi:hypothetical protein